MTGKLDVVIAGGGRVGFQTAELLNDQGHDVTIVESDPDRCAAIADEYVATVIEGDATHPDILEQADVAGADAVAALTGVTGQNLAVCMEVREMAPSSRTVARVDRSNSEGYTRFVDAILYPERAGARVAATEVVGGDVRTLGDVTGRLDIMEVRVAEGAPVAGKRLADVAFPAGALVISNDDGDSIAGPETTLTAGRQYVVAVDPDVASEVMNLMRG